MNYSILELLVNQKTGAELLNIINELSTIEELRLIALMKLVQKFNVTDAPPSFTWVVESKRLDKV